VGQSPSTKAPRPGGRRRHYIDDLPEVRGTLHAAPILARGPRPLHGVDASAALALPGVRGVVLAADIPGDPILAAFGHDEPIFAQDTVQHIGQVIGLVVADSVMAARRAARKVQCDITPLPALLTCTTPTGQKLCAAARACARGDAAAGLAAPATGCKARWKWAAGAFLPGRPDRLRPAAGAGPVVDLLQHPAPRRGAALGGARAGHRQPRGAVECRRMGGGFGGKETQAGHLAVWAALAARKATPRQAAAGPRRRLHGHRQAPPVCLRLRRGL
jgi:xanthine dehydrogenase large subunit